VPAVDVGAICGDGALRTLADCGEIYVITGFAEGTEYAADLRRAARARRLDDGDRERAAELARYLVGLHRMDVEPRPERYTRSVRDLVGDGEGIYGIVDGYPDQVPAAPPERLRAIEEQCATWRWRLRGRERRLARIHGDFHPFNLLHGPDGRLALLDASRGSTGDPADDVTCLAVNFVFFALDHPGSWPALGELSRAFWRTYLEESGDRELLEVAPPYWAWRSLVLANPLWYPALAPESRDTLLSLAEEALAAGRLDPERAERVLR
jgi:aminoglycoside phosphotransferase (APT) family kinase protein